MPERRSRTAALGWHLARIVALGREAVAEVQRNLALIANTIAKYEPVNMLVNGRDSTLAQSLVCKNVTLHVAH